MLMQSGIQVMQSGIHVCGVNALLLPRYSCFWLLCCGRDNGLFAAVVFQIGRASCRERV